VDYVSIGKPDREGRIIVPHTLVFTGLRWHARAWCEKNRAYRDFVLSRFRGEPELLERSEHSGEDDTDWHRRVCLELIPDPRLSPAQQDVVIADYGMQDGILRIETRAALAAYALRLLQVGVGVPERPPEAQQLVVANLDSLEPWLFPQR
jgi:predicted DNA-binding transcriptional regulator YafY